MVLPCLLFRHLHIMYSAHDRIILSVLQYHRFIVNIPSILPQPCPDTENFRLRLQNQFLKRRRHLRVFFQNPYGQSSSHAGDHRRGSFPWIQGGHAVGKPGPDSVLQAGFPDIFPGALQRSGINVQCQRTLKLSGSNEKNRDIGMIRSDVRQTSAPSHHACNRAKAHGHQAADLIRALSVCSISGRLCALSSRQISSRPRALSSRQFSSRPRTLSSRQFSSRPRALSSRQIGGCLRLLPSFLCFSSQFSHPRRSGQRFLPEVFPPAAFFRILAP